MTSRERVIAALERREPDRLPTFEWRISRPIIEAIDADSFVDEFGVRRHFTGADKYPVAVKRFGRKRAVVVNLHDVFSFPRDMMGLDRFLMAFILEPELVRAIVGWSVDYNIELAKLVKLRGVEIIGIGDDLADNKAPFVSPAMFIVDIDIVFFHVLYYVRTLLSTF
jgi:hypothetical protein